MCRSRREMVGKEYHTPGALDNFDLKMSGHLNGARITYNGQEHSPNRDRVSPNAVVSGQLDAVQAG